MGNRKDYEAVLKVLSESSPKSDEFWAILKRKLPINTPWRVSKSALGWENVAESSGWVLQQNAILKNVRIVDSESWRRAFDFDFGHFFGVMDELVRKLHESDDIGPSSGTDPKLDKLALLEYLWQLYQKGAITKEEYEEQKKELL